jgi:hypothetical protein
MPTYKITASDGKVLRITGDKRPSQEELDDIFSKVSAKQAQPQQSQNKQATKDKTALQSVFPALSKAKEHGGGRVRRAVAEIGDILNLPARTAAAIGAGLGTLQGGGGLGKAKKVALSELGKTKSDETGALGILQDIALDPTSSPLLLGLGAAAKGGGAAVKGGGAVAKAAPRIGSALLKTIGTGAATGAGSAAYQGAAGSGISKKQVATQAALGAATGAVTHGLGKATGKFLKGAAEKNLDILLKPGRTGEKLGYNHANVIKHDLGGSAEEIARNAGKKLGVLQKKAKSIADKSNDVFNLDDIFDKAKLKLSARKSPEDFIKQTEFIDLMKNDYKNAFGDIVDAADAMEIRTLIGDKSSFVGRSQGGMKIDPDADWKETVYNSIYNEIKNNLHSKLGGKLKAINKAQSEIIPIKVVAERRLPIESQNQRIGLSDLLTGQIGQSLGGAAIGAGVGGGTSGDIKGALKGAAIGAGVAGLRKGLGGKTSTKALYKLGQRLSGEKIPLNRIGR